MVNVPEKEQIIEGYLDWARYNGETISEGQARSTILAFLSDDSVVEAYLNSGYREHPEVFGIDVYARLNGKTYGFNSSEGFASEDSLTIFRNRAEEIKNF